MLYDENEICKKLLKSYKQGLDAYFESVSELTGLHVIILVDGDRIYTV